MVAQLTCYLQHPNYGGRDSPVELEATVGIEQGHVQYSAEEDDFNDIIWEMFEGDVQYSAEEDDFIDIINELYQIRHGGHAREVD